jgi:hypothetical protein
VNALDAIAQARGFGVIEYAVPNWVYHHDATSNDPYVISDSLWGMTGAFGSGASIYWSAKTVDASKIFIGIIDEGYMYTHEDLSANAGVNPP